MTHQLRHKGVRLLLPLLPCTCPWPFLCKLLLMKMMMILPLLLPFLELCLEQQLLPAVSAVLQVLHTSS